MLHKINIFESMRAYGRRFRRSDLLPSIPITHEAEIEKRIHKISTEMKGRKEGMPRGNSIVIGGVARIGKSLLASEISRRFGFIHVKADRYRRSFWKIHDPQLRHNARRYAYIRLLQEMPYNIVIEGDDFISENRLYKCGAKPLDLSLLKLLQNEVGAEVRLMLPANSSFDARFLALIKGRESGECWTINKLPSEKDLQRFVQSAIKLESTLREMADSSSIEVIEINFQDFDKDLDRLVADIEERIIR